MTADELDHTPLTFGKYRGRTPDEISKTKDGAQYILWMFENVENRDTCSRLLYEACGGKKLPPPVNTDDEILEDGDMVSDVRRKTGYDDMDDDIPF